MDLQRSTNSMPLNLSKKKSDDDNNGALKMGGNEGGQINEPIQDETSTLVDEDGVGTDSSRIHVGSTFSSKDAFRLLMNPQNLTIRKGPLREAIKPNSVYAFDTSQSDLEYWKDDRKSWAYGFKRQEPVRDDKKLVWRRQYKLLHSGETVDFFRDEIWEQNGGKELKPPKWSPPLILVYYHGTFPINSSRNAEHGNLGKKRATKKIFNQQSSQYKRKKVNENFYQVDMEEGDISLEAHSECHPVLTTVELRNDPGYTTTPKSTLRNIDGMILQKIAPARIQRELNLQEIYNEDDDSDKEGPRNKKQIQNRLQARKQKVPQHNNDLADVYAFGIDYPKILRKFDLLPGLMVMAGHPQLESHFSELYNVVPYIVLFYDTTFNLGNRFVSILSGRHPGLLGNPIYPINLLYHEYTDKKFTHGPFFTTISSYVRKFNSKKTVIITDREKSIKSAIQEFLPNSHHVFCYRHIFKNVQRWVAKNKYKADQKQRFYVDVKKLLWSSSVKDYDDLLEKLCNSVADVDVENDEDVEENEDFSYSDILDAAKKGELDDEKNKCTPEPWDPKFKSYYMKCLDTDIKQSFRGAVVKFGIFNVHSGITTNPGESVNAVLQSSVAADTKPTLYSLVLDVYDFQTSQLLEIKKGLWLSKGNHRMDPQFSTKRESLTKINLKESRIDRSDDRREVSNGKIFSINLDINYPTKTKYANALVENRMVDYVRDGNWMVTDKDKAWLVNFPDQTCSCSAKTRCVHTLAVKIAIGVERDPNFENLNYVKPTNISQIYKTKIDLKVGKKGPGNRVPVVYESPVQEEEQSTLNVDVNEDNETNVSKNGNDKYISSFLENILESPPLAPPNPCNKNPDYWSRRAANCKNETMAILMFKEIPFVHWGSTTAGRISYIFSNTCPIDNALFTLAAMRQWYPVVQTFLEEDSQISKSEVTKDVIEAVGLVLQGNVNKAKYVWVEKVQRIQLISRKDGVNDLWGSEEEKSLLPMQNIFRRFLEVTECPVHQMIRQQMESTCSYSRASVVSTLAEIEGKTHTRNQVRCVWEGCKEKMRRNIFPPTRPLPFVVFHVSENEVNDVPREINFLGTKYKLFSASLFQRSRAHFVAGFPYGEQWIIFDSKGSNFTIGLPSYTCVSLTWYIKI